MFDFQHGFSPFNTGRNTGFTTIFTGGAWCAFAKCALHDTYSATTILLYSLYCDCQSLFLHFFGSAGLNVCKIPAFSSARKSKNAERPVSVLFSLSWFLRWHPKHRWPIFFPHFPDPISRAVFFSCHSHFPVFFRYNKSPRKTTRVLRGG